MAASAAATFSGEPEITMDFIWPLAVEYSTPNRPTRPPMACGSTFCSTTSLVIRSLGGVWASIGAASNSAISTIRFIFHLLELICNPVNDNLRVRSLKLDGEWHPRRGRRSQQAAGTANYLANRRNHFRHLRRGRNRRQQARSLGRDARRPQRQH